MNPHVPSIVHALARVAGVAVMYVVLVAGMIHLAEIGLALYRKARNRRLLHQLIIATANAAQQLGWRYAPSPPPAEPQLQQMRLVDPDLVKQDDDIEDSMWV